MGIVGMGIIAAVVAAFRVGVSLGKRMEREVPQQVRDEIEEMIAG
jgi:hypothetical protein